MGKRKLSPQEQAERDAENALNNQRWEERESAENTAKMEARRAAITSVLPDYKPEIGPGEPEAEAWVFDDLETLPKWLGDLVEEIEAHYSEGNLDSMATAAAREAGEAAKHAAYVETYGKAYREEFARRFALAIANREGRVVTEYDYDKIVDGDTTKTVHIFATEAEADAFRDTLVEKRKTRQEAHKAALRVERSANRHIAEIYDLTGAKRPAEDD